MGMGNLSLSRIFLNMKLLNIKYYKDIYSGGKKQAYSVSHLIKKKQNLTNTFL